MNRFLAIMVMRHFHERFNHPTLLKFLKHGVIGNTVPRVVRVFVVFFAWFNMDAAACWRAYKRCFVVCSISCFFVHSKYSAKYSG